jgi:hypothetical protein
MVGMTSWMVPTGLATLGFQRPFLALAAAGVMLGLYTATGLKFEPPGRGVDELAPATSTADATTVCRRTIEQRQ